MVGYFRTQKGNNNPRFKEEKEMTKIARTISSLDRILAIKGCSEIMELMKHKI